jgi:hypothetical protein
LVRVIEFIVLEFPDTATHERTRGLPDTAALPQQRITEDCVPVHVEEAQVQRSHFRTRRILILTVEHGINTVWNLFGGRN